jgi:oligosaccharyltransferase complex subunit alpha (ribophorin I)
MSSSARGKEGLMYREAPTVAIDLGDIKKDGSVTLSLTYVLIHASTPLPASIEQKDAQYLIWKTNSTYVDSWYPSDVERIKIRQVTPHSPSYHIRVDR